MINTKEYKNYLFTPFTDNTSAVESCEAGRYLDCSTTDIQNGILMLDFNKAYNPYCAYVSGYDCPVPPPVSSLTGCCPNRPLAPVIIIFIRYDCFIIY